MPDWLTLALAIAAPGGVIVTLIERTRRENCRGTAITNEFARRIDAEVHRIGERLDDHIEWHLSRELEGR